MTDVKAIHDDAKSVAVRFKTWISRTQHNTPLRLLDTVVVGLRVTEGSDVDLVGLGDLVLGTVSDEDGLSSPLDDDLIIPSTLVSHSEVPHTA